MTSLPRTAHRVQESSSEAANRAIEQRMARTVAFCAEHPQFIESRLRALDAEWDTERVLQANAATLALGGTLLGILWDRRMLALPLVVTTFLLQHAVQGWCPPLEIIRRMGVRTADEIGRERAALKALRGDFARVPQGAPEARAVAALQAAT